MKALLKGGASVALLALALYLLDWRAVAGAARRLTFWEFFAAVLLACAQFVPLLVRWHRLVGTESGWYRASARYLYANMLNFVSPGNLGGDVYRFFAFRSQARNSAALVAILVRERLLGLTSMLIGLVIGVAGIEFAAMEPGRGAWRLLGAASAMALVLLMAALPVCARLLNDPWRSHILSAWAPHRAGESALLVGWSLLALVLWSAMAQFLAVRLGVEVPWYLLLAVVTAAELVRIVPITIQGIGLREGAYAALFALSGVPSEGGFILGAVAYLALSVALVATGALGLTMLLRLGTGRTG